MTFNVTDNQYGRLSYRQLGFLLLLHVCAAVRTRLQTLAETSHDMA